MIYPADLLNALVASLQLSNLGQHQTIHVRHFRSFYDEGMEPLWFLVYDVDYHNSDLGQEDRHERRFAMGQGMRMHMDSIAEHMKGW